MISKVRSFRMTEKKAWQTEIEGYLAAVFADADLLGLADDQAIAASSGSRSAEADEAVLKAGRSLLAEDRIDWQRLANFANRQFESEQELRDWLNQVLDRLEKAVAASRS